MNSFTRRDFIRSAFSAGALVLAPKLNLHAFRQELPNVLIIGDSISMGYTPFVKKIIGNKANVSHPDENCGPTERGVQNIEKWLGDKKYKVIYFNFGLHDLKHVDAITKKPSVKREDPLLADFKTYEANLNAIAEKLRTTGAKLIFATTSPVPQHSTPLRDPEMPPQYNAVAIRVMNRQGIEVDDLYSFILPQVEKIRQPNNVHYTPEGYKIIGEHVAVTISKYL